LASNIVARAAYLIRNVVSVKNFVKPHQFYEPFMPIQSSAHHRENLPFSTLLQAVVIVLKMKCDFARHADGAA
jgi:hypothetical protein